jgi:hypothetical protein
MSLQLALSEGFCGLLWGLNMSQDISDLTIVWMDFGVQQWL